MGDLRHRRVSLLHLRGVPWARMGEFVGQRNLAVTANTYTHVLVDENRGGLRGADRNGLTCKNMRKRARSVLTPVLPLGTQKSLICSGASNPAGGISGRLAQLGERLPYKQEVRGSSPSPPTHESPAQAGFSLTSPAAAKPLRPE